MTWQGIIKHYFKYLPVGEHAPVVTLNEGNTLLLRASRLEKELDLPARLYLKFEGQNPTGSFKDRGMTLAVTKALEDNSQGVICASTGNTSASAAAYAARAGLPCFVLIPQGAIAMGKLAQAVTYGAEVIAVEGNFDDALSLVRAVTDKYPITLVNSLNPYRLEGQKTGAFEICDQLGHAPSYLAIPVGNAGNITAYWQGFKEYSQGSTPYGLPKMIGFQAEGAAPIVRGCVIKNPETVATAIRIGNPASWDKAVNAAVESGGSISMVSDEEILEAYRMIARLEGLFVEPASAASVAGVKRLNREGVFTEEDTVVCILTGHGLKDPDLAVEIGDKPKVIRPELGELERLL